MRQNEERGGCERRLCGSLGPICRVTVRVRVADCCVQTAGESDKMRINHVIKTDQWRFAPQIRPAPHSVLSRKTHTGYIRLLYELLPVTV